VGNIVWRLRITIDGHTYDALVEELEAAGPAPAPVPPPAPEPPPAAVPAAGAPAPAPAAGEVRAPLPGVVTEVRCRVGQAVAAGQVLLILEAMKMDNEIGAPSAGTVRELRVARGDAVEPGQVLVVVG
jgi:biotin carboxyl carrier protein